MRTDDAADKLKTIRRRIERTAIRRDYWLMVAQMPDCTEGVRRLAEFKAQRWEDKYLLARLEEAKLLYEMRNGG